MRKRIIFILLISNCIAIIAQVNVNPELINEDTIRIYNSDNDVSYYNAGKKIDYRSIESILTKNSKALMEFSKFKDYNTSATVIMFGGMGFMAYGIYTHINNENIYLRDTTNSNLLFVGIGAILVSIPLVVESKIHLKNSVSIYNN